MLQMQVWGVGGGGTFESKSKGGNWSSIEQTYYIYAKERLTAFLGLRSFAESKRITYLIKINNETAVAHINRMGGIKSELLNHLSKQI